MGWDGNRCVGRCFRLYYRWHTGSLVRLGQDSNILARSSAYHNSDRCGGSSIGHGLQTTRDPRSCEREKAPSARCYLRESLEMRCFCLSTPVDNGVLYILALIDDLPENLLMYPSVHLIFIISATLPYSRSGHVTSQCISPRSFDQRFSTSHT